MRRNFAFLSNFALSLCAVCSCSDELQTSGKSYEEDSASESSVDEILVNAPSFVSIACDDEAKSAVEVNDGQYQFVWSEDDVIGIFPDKGGQVAFSMENGAGQKSAMFDGGGWGLKTSSSYSAYFPIVPEFNLDKNAIPVNLGGQTQEGNGSTEHLGQLDYMAAVNCSVQDGKVRFDFEHKIAVLHFKIAAPAAGKYSRLVLFAGADIPEESSLNLSDGSVVPVGYLPYGQLKLKKIKVGQGEAIDLFMVINPIDLKDKKPLIVLFDEDSHAYKASLKGRVYEAGNFYHYEKTVTADSSYDGLLSVPVVSIVTENGELPSFKVVKAPEGMFGSSITDVTKVKSGMKVISPDGDVVFDSGKYEKDKSGLTIKVRGNTSATASQHPYKLKLQKKADLLFREDGAVHSDKNWVLLQPNIRTLIGYRMNSLMGLAFAPQAELVKVFINGKDNGYYLLSECVERNSDSRIDVDKKTGYIIERDAYWWNESVYFNTVKFPVGSQYGFTFKYPDADDVTGDQIEYIKSVMENVETSIKNGQYDELIDVDSFAAWLLGHDILGTYDSGGSNMYFTKYDNTESTKVFMTGMWDFDSIENSSLSDKWSRVHTSTHSYFKDLLSSKNKAFVDSYKKKWENVKPDLYSSVMEYLNSIKNSDQADAWGREYLEKEVKKADNWFGARVQTLDGKIGAL